MRKAPCVLRFTVHLILHQAHPEYTDELPVETAEISYRVADFLKKHPPFNAIDDADLLALASRGRVRFHEPFEYLLWQGEPHRHQVFVIQQGTVSLWDESGGTPELRDVRGAGDLLGLERYNGAPHTLHSARSESDVVIYAFPAHEFDQYVLASPHAAQYIAADGRLTKDYQGAVARREPHRTFLHTLVAHTPLTTCQAGDSIAGVAVRLLGTSSGSVAVLDADQRLRGVLTADRLVRWIADGGGDARQQTIETLLSGSPTVVSPDAAVSDGVLAMSDAGVSAVAITADGTTGSNVLALVSSFDLARSFGEQPASLLRDAHRADNIEALRDINRRARTLALDLLTSASAVEWLARLMHLADVAIVTRLLTLEEMSTIGGCWCFAGSSGREESLTTLAPHLVVLLENDAHASQARERYRRVLSRLEDCGYLPRQLAYDADFYVASTEEWTDRYRNWVRDPITRQMHRGRTLFDLRPVIGAHGLWNDVAAAVAETIDRDFLRVLANDCLGSLPPLTFYEDAVVDSDGDYVSTFKLEESAVRPLVDVGRVFGMAGGSALGGSTLGRFAAARTLLPDHEEIFREAAVTFRAVLWEQARVGITQGTSGAELPPALLSRHDRHVLKSGFRSILHLLQFTAAGDWFNEL
jgi:CBS domain-containing protein